MAWDFETEPEFEAKLAWMREFMKEEVFPLETLAAEFRSPEGRAVYDKITADWKWLVDEVGITNDSRYLHENGGLRPRGRR